MAPSPRRKTALNTAPSSKPTAPTPKPNAATLNRRERNRRNSNQPRKPRAFPSRSNFYGQSSEDQGKTLQGQAGYFASQAMKGAQNYDPNNPYAGMSEQGFQGQLDQARESVMGQFERSMGPQFQREEDQFRQRMAEQGIDPNSGAYQVQFNNMKEAQNAARQGAEAQAFQLGAGYQQQGFQQGMQGRMMPFEQAQAMQPFFTLPYQTQAAGKQADLQRQFEAEQLRVQNEQRMREAQLGASTSMGTAQLGAQTQRDIATMQMVNSQYGNQPQQAPPWYNYAIQGAVQGGTAGVINRMNKPS